MRVVDKDQYFTRVEDAERLIDIVNEMFPMSEYDIVLEPSAGKGSFFNILPDNRVGLDLEPLAEGIIEQDFFEYDYLPFTKYLTIGNPPFGRKAKIAKQFIIKAAEFSDVIAFILPAIFNKHTLVNWFPEYFHLEYQEPITQFVMPDGELRDVNCVFQIWKRRDVKRDKIIKPKTHPDFTMTHRHVSWLSEEELKEVKSNSHFTIGQITGKVNELEDVIKGSHFFVKDLTKDSTVKSIMNKMDFSYQKSISMGAVSLAVSDIIEEYERVKNGNDR